MTPILSAVKGRGEFTTFKISRRALLFQFSNAVVASTVAAVASEPPRRDQKPSSELQALIEAHQKVYTALGRAVREMGGSRDYDGASRAEERALLAVCACPAVRKSDRLAKGRYLLEIEARGELDLPEHIQALLRSTM